MQNTFPKLFIKLLISLEVTNLEVKINVVNGEQIQACRERIGQIGQGFDPKLLLCS